MVNSLPVGDRGPKHLTPRDWLFGSRPRRLALAAILLGRTPVGGWTREDLASAAKVTLRGIDAHLDGFERLGLIERDGRAFRLVAGAPLVTDLQRLLRSLESSTSDDRAV